MFWWANGERLRCAQRSLDFLVESHAMVHCANMLSLLSIVQVEGREMPLLILFLKNPCVDSFVPLGFIMDSASEYELECSVNLFLS